MNQFKTGDRVSIFYPLGDGTYVTRGVVRDVEGENYLIEETEYDYWVWNSLTQQGHFEQRPFKPRKFYQDSATRWFRPRKDDSWPNEYIPDRGHSCEISPETPLNSSIAGIGA